MPSEPCWVSAIMDYCENGLGLHMVKYVPAQRVWHCLSGY